MEHPPAPEPRELLPPLLACLPTTFISSRPPPALLPLLAPILRQRLTFLARSESTTGDGWVKLLCWDPQQAAKLPSVVEALDLEPHPVSGEVELDDIQTIEYKRLDNDTLHARFRVPQFHLLPTYLWCRDDEDAKAGPGWKLADLRTLDDATEDRSWFSTISQANQAYGSTSNQTSESPLRKQSVVGGGQDDGDDSYWAAYDLTPGRIPAAPQSTALAAPANPRSPQAQTDGDYYARYGVEVQPAMDAHDPEEDVTDLGKSTLNGTQQRFHRPISLEITGASPATGESRPAWQKALYPHIHKAPTAHDSVIADNHARSNSSDLNMPRPISPASSIRSVEKLEQQAAAMSDENAGSTRFELGARQHISTEVKSLFRLAKTAGMTRVDFEQLVRRELDVLGLLDDDDDDNNDD